MRIGIFGFAGAGKTTVFNILTGLDADTGYGGSKINLGVTRVPEKRVDFLADIYQPKKKVALGKNLNTLLFVISFCPLLVR